MLTVENIPDIWRSRESGLYLEPFEGHCIYINFGRFEVFTEDMESANAKVLSSVDRAIRRGGSSRRSYVSLLMKRGVIAKILVLDEELVVEDSDRRFPRFRGVSDDEYRLFFFYHEVFHLHPVSRAVNVSGSVKEGISDISAIIAMRQVFGWDEVHVKKFKKSVALYRKSHEVHKFRRTHYNQKVLWGATLSLDADGLVDILEKVLVDVKSLV